MPKKLKSAPGPAKTVPEMFQAALRLQQANRLAEAEQLYRAIVAREPAHADALAFLGIIEHQTGRNQAAIDHLRRAVAINSSVAHYHTFLAAAHRSLEQFAAAVPHYRKSLELNPDQAGIHHNLGMTLQKLGKDFDALEHFERAIAIDPASTDSYCQLAEGRVYRAGDPFFAAVEGALRAPGLSDFAQADLHFALAKMHDDCDEFERAFQHARIANELRPGKFNYARHQERTEKLKSVFDAAFFASHADFGVATDLPIFIVGLPRAGKSLIEHILAHYPGVAGIGERNDIQDIARAMPKRVPTSLPYPDCMPLLQRELARQMAEEHLKRIGEAAAGEAGEAGSARGQDAAGSGLRHIVDTTPPNFTRLGLIALLFPKARIINCRRDPLDQGLACYMRGINDRQPFAGDLVHFGQYYRLYDDLMAHWRAVLPVRLLDVDYEAVVAQPESEARRIVEFCGLEWDARCLARPYLSAPLQSTEHSGAISARYVGRWRHYEKFLAPLQAALAGAS